MASYLSVRMLSILDLQHHPGMGASAWRKPAHSERRSKGWSFPKLNLMFPEWGGQTKIGFCNNVRGLFPIADSGLSQEASLQGASLAAGSEDQLNNQPHNSSVMQRPWGLFPPSGRAPCLPQIRAFFSAATTVQDTTTPTLGKGFTNKCNRNV